MSSYHAGWNIAFRVNDAQYAWLATFIDTLNQGCGAWDEELLDEAKKAYPTFAIDATEIYNQLEYERCGDDIIIYNNECDGGSEQGAEIVFAYLKHFGLPTRIGFLVASLEGNDAWGGCYYITKHEIKWKSLGDLLEQMAQESQIDWQIPT